jgi:hypothetical protein
LHVTTPQLLQITPALQEVLLSELYGYSMPLTTLVVKKEFLLNRPLLIFQPTANKNRGKQCQYRISHLGKMHNYEVSTYISVFSGGV